MDTLLLSTAYLPPVDYLQAAAQAEAIVIDSAERYRKQSYRNRCEVGHSQGRLALVVPVVRPDGHLTPIDRVGVDYSTAWVRNHLGALRSAYGRTPFFEHYYPEFSSALTTPYPSLLELNVRLLRLLFETFGLLTAVRVEPWGEATIPPTYRDARAIYHPKRPRAACGEYYQAFGDRLPFLANLSAVDLLFNEGPSGLRLC